jgi:hypothetical protein
MKKGFEKLSFGVNSNCDLNVLYVCLRLAYYCKRIVDCFIVSEFSMLNGIKANLHRNQNQNRSESLAVVLLAILSACARRREISVSITQDCV